MGVIARPALLPPLPWRPIGIVLILGLLIAAGVLILAGSQPKLPPPFGLARNGAILYSTVEGDIYTVDEVSGVSRVLIGGPDTDSVPTWSPDGTRILFLRRAAATSGGNALFIANGDGTGIRRLTDRQTDLGGMAWSPDGSKAAVTYLVKGVSSVSIIEVNSGSTTTLPLGMEAIEASWRANREQIVFRGTKSEAGGETFAIYLVNADGTGLRPLTNPTLAETDPMTPVLSPDGRRLMYIRWNDAVQGEIHVTDIETGIDHVVSVGVAGDTLLTPHFSPDGTKVLVERYAAGTTGFRLVVASVDGTTPEVEMGPRKPEGINGAPAAFSPDGSKVIATYGDDDSIWFLDIATGTGEQASWTAASLPTWQRLAP